MSVATVTGDSSAANARLIERFYSAFGRRDVDAMLGCYHPQVVFSDPVFGTLAAAEAGAMWRMLNRRARMEPSPAARLSLPAPSPPSAKG